MLHPDIFFVTFAYVRSYFDHIQSITLIWSLFLDCQENGRLVTCANNFVVWISTSRIIVRKWVSAAARRTRPIRCCRPREFMRYSSAWVTSSWIVTIPRTCCRCIMKRVICNASIYDVGWIHLNGSIGRMTPIRIRSNICDAVIPGPIWKQLIKQISLPRCYITYTFKLKISHILRVVLRNKIYILGG